MGGLEPVDDERYRKIEERVAWLERHVLEQDKAMMELGDELTRARKALQQMQERVRSGGDTGEISDTNERPPHY